MSEQIAYFVQLCYYSLGKEFSYSARFSFQILLEVLTVTLFELYSINYGWCKDACIDIHFEDEEAISYNLIPIETALKELGDREVAWFVDDLVVLV